MQRNLAVRFLFLIAVTAILTGCNESPFDLAPVRGTVTLNGRPITQGKVMFAPIRTGPGLEAGKPAIGVIQKDGSFRLTTYRDGDGAVVGEHWVTIFGPERPTALTQDARPVSDPPSAVPSFDRLSMTEKQLVLSGVQNEISISLTSADIEKYATRGD